MDSGFRSPLYKKTSFLLRRLSIKNRLLTAFLITSLLPVAIVAFYSNQIYEASITDKISAYSSQTLTELTRNISRELGQYETLSENIIINDSIQYGLTSYAALSDIDKNTLQTRIRNELGPQFFSFSNLSNIVIMTNDGATFFDLGYQWYPDNQLSSMIQQTEGAPRNAYWSYLRSNRGSTVIALSRKIYSAENLNLQIGYLVITMDEKVFARNMFQSVDLGQDSSVYITDRSGATISSSTSSLPQGSLNQADLTARIEKQHESGRLQSFQTKIRSKQYLVSSTYIDAADWYLVGLIPHSYIVSELGDLRGNIALLCLLTLILSSAIGLWIYDSINSPLRSLLRYAKRIHKGRFDPIPKPVAPPDEMQQLTITIHDMVTELKLLIRQVQLEQQAKREAELKMLQAQINPHFLFNTLNSLKWSAMLSGNESLTQGIGSLSELLRNTILDREELIPLSKEMANLRHYSNIQRIRYGDSFELECQPVEPDEDVIVPKFILQPIVENSILHGAAHNKRILISISFAFHRSDLILTLSDDGKGFDPAELEHKDHTGSRLSGIGIPNVHERIQLHYGAAFGLRTESAPGQGTTTVLTLPLHFVQEEDKAYV